MSKLSIKVDLSESKPDDLIHIGESVLQKHIALGASSPLHALDMAVFEKNLADGKAKRAEAKRLHDEAEKLNQQAGLNLGTDKTQNVATPGTVYSTLARARDILLGIHKGQEKNLNEWGFSVTISDVVMNGKAANPTK
jgi:hypothetical protein